MEVSTLELSTLDALRIEMLLWEDTRKSQASPQYYAYANITNPKPIHPNIILLH